MQCENVKINGMIVIFTELFRVHLTITTIVIRLEQNDCTCLFVYILSGENDMVLSATKIPEQIEHKCIHDSKRLKDHYRMVLVKV